MRAALLCLLLGACDSSVVRLDECSGTSDTCVTFHLTAEPALGDPLINQIAMWVTYNVGSGAQNKFLPSVAMQPPAHFPIAVGLDLPSTIAGTIKVRIEALSGPGPAAYRVVSLMPKAGQHLDLDVIMQSATSSLCFDGARQTGSESDIDCGFDCPPCGSGRRCNVAADCQSAMCNSSFCL